MSSFLYRYRGIIGLIAFWFVYLCATPENKAIFLSLPLVLLGLTIRVWAIGYIGKHSRTKEIYAPMLITSGPYRYIKHPLYLGNFFLVMGVLLALSATFIISVIVLFLFLIEYLLFIHAEEKYLKVKFSKENQTQNCARFNSAQGFNWQNVLMEINTITIIIVIYGLIILKIYLRSS